MTERTSRLRLIIDSSDARTAARDIDRFLDQTDKAGRETDQLRRSTDNAGNAMRGLANAARALVAALAVREVLQFADSFQQAQNRIRLVTDSTEELISVQERLQEISLRTLNTFSGSADLYSRLARSTEELGISNERLLRITETVNKTISLSGTSAQAAQAALFQLGQGLGAGALRGEELNSVLEQTPELARAIADGLGKSIAELRQLGAEGALTAEAVISALEKQADAVDDAFEKIEPTIGQVSTVIREAFGNALVEEFVDELGEAGLKAIEIREAFTALGTIFGQVFAVGLQGLVEFAELIDEVAFQLERIGAIKPEIEIDASASFDALTDELVEIEARIEAITRNLTKPSLLPIGLDIRRDPETAIQELTQLQVQAEEIRGLLTNQLAPAAKTLITNVSDLSAVFEESEGAELSDDQLKKLAKSAEDARAAFEKFASVNLQSGSDAVLQTFDQRVEAVFTEEGIRQLGQSLDSVFLQRRDDIGRSLARGEISTEEADKLIENLEEDFQGIKAAINNRGKEIADEVRGISVRGISLAAESITGIADGIAGGLDQISRSILDSNASLLDRISGISGGFGNVASGLGDAFSEVGGQFFGQLSTIFSAAGPIGQAISAVAGAVDAAIGLFKSLFGQASSGGTFSLDGGGALFARNSVSDERNQQRDAIGSAAVQAANAIADIIGGAFEDSVGLRIFIDKNDQLLASLRDINNNALIALPQGASNDSRGVTGDVGEAISQGVLLLLENAFEGGEEVLKDYAIAALSAGRSTQSVLEGLDSLSGVLELAADPLSQIEQQLASIDAVIDPVIEDLQSLGQSIAGIEEVAQRAERAIGSRFISDIENEILSFRNSTVGDFKRILDDQERLLNDAKTLLERGAITPAEFDLVQVRNALERQNFFESLSAEELESLGDFFGLIENSGGAVAVVLTQLTKAFSDFVDSVAETRENLQQQADQLQSYADQIFRTRDQIDQRFPSLSGGELLGDLRGQLANLRERALAGDDTAFEQIPDLANRLVNLARDIFGSTSDFAEQRDFALSVLDQTGSLAESRANKLLSEIEALNTQVDVLNDIRDILESPDASIEYLQAQLDQGLVTNDLIRQLLAQYIALTQEARAGSLTPSEAQAATEGFLSAGGAAGQSSTVSIDRFDENITLLAQIRDEIRRSNADQLQALQSIRNEQRRSGTNATLTAG